MTGRSVGFAVGRPVLGWLVPLVPERGHLGSQQVLSYASNFLYNETGYEMTNVIKASSHLEVRDPREIFTMANTGVYTRPSFSFSFFLSLSPGRISYRNVFIYDVRRDVVVI